jgi:hypothetical protein
MRTLRWSPCAVSASSAPFFESSSVLFPLRLSPGHFNGHLQTADFSSKPVVSYIFRGLMAEIDDASGKLERVSKDDPIRAQWEKFVLFLTTHLF